ncbi:MAG TPA: transcriptional regulator [Steroidobacteraceae bacterium]|jgi:DNA-binding MarR family transcriptional regulator|nr:transcriptional regulator [Steroidobacteraceae bacterium]
MGASIDASAGRAEREPGGADCAALHPDGADEIIHQPLRLRIMAVLNSLPTREPLDFTQLRASVQATDGNLGAHLGTLERAGYVEIHKDFVGKRPRTRVSISAGGRLAFARHVAYLRGVIDLASPRP